MTRARLNPAQRRAVEHQAGPLLVLAGAGSGKTRVITERVARLVERGVPGRTIAALTFTNKAAGEMRERIESALRQNGSAAAAREPTICTFHSFGLMVLGRERTTASGAFTIFDQGDALAAVKEAMRGVASDRKYDAAAVLARISLAKNAFVAAEDLPETGEYAAITKRVLPRYQAMLRGFHAYDFDDLVCEVARLFRERADVRARWQHRYQYVLVDEYQDTNRAQLELLLHLCAEHRNLCVVGDDDQAIYGWRGADVRNILDFEAHFPGAKVIKLEQNYRSRQPILDVANAVIAKRADAKYRKVLHTNKLGGEMTLAVIAPSPDVEAAYVADELRRLVKDEHKRPRQLAVLYRSNGQAKVLEESLREHGLPYRIVGGQQFFERKEVKDVLGYLRLALNKNDEISLRRVVNTPARGIGDTSLQRLTDHALAKGGTLLHAVEHADALTDLPSGAVEGCRQLTAALAELKRALTVERRPASDAARALCARIGLRADLEAASGSVKIAARRWGNVEGLFETLRRREEREQRAGMDPTGAPGLRAFLQALALQSTEHDEGAEPADQITLSTLHGSKGLEFDHVFLVGCEEGLLPHARTLDARATDMPTGEGPAAGAASLEEERRLFYVGVTRARERLVLCRCKTRIVRGKAQPRTPSRFLCDIPAELLVYETIERAPSMAPEQMTAQANALLAALDRLG